MPGPVLTGRGDNPPRPSRPLLRAILGDVLRRIRREQGRTLADVAAAARISLPYLSELERGCKEASSEILAAICDALDTDLAEILAEAGRELAAGQARRVPVLRLTSIGGPAAAGRLADPAAPAGGTAGRPGQAQCLLAA
jgi:transcriptional regulator with XRE-family HTH domain